GRLRRVCGLRLDRRFTRFGPYSGGRGRGTGYEKALYGRPGAKRGLPTVARSKRGADVRLLRGRGLRGGRWLVGNGRSFSEGASRLCHCLGSAPREIPGKIDLQSFVRYRVAGLSAG